MNDLLKRKFQHKTNTYGIIFHIFLTRKKTSIPSIKITDQFLHINYIFVL